MHQMPPGDVDTTLAVALAEDLSVPIDIVEMGLNVALSAARKARHAVEDNADSAEPNDGAALRQVHAHLLDIVGNIAGALACVEQRRRLKEMLEEADTERPPTLRLVK